MPIYHKNYRDQDATVNRHMQGTCPFLSKSHEAPCDSAVWARATKQKLEQSIPKGTFTGPLAVLYYRLKYMKRAPK